MPLTNYLTLGRSGLRVSPFCLGTMTFGEDWGWGASREESRKIFDAYVARGGNFIDTANAYTFLGGLHKRLDELDHRLDRHEMRLDAMPTSVGTPIREKLDGVERMVREQLDATARAMDESAEGVRNLLAG